MKLISKIYEHYQLMPSLMLHQYRVAAVASMIIDHYDQPLERHAVVSACLLHDMANIIKSDLQQFPQFLQPRGLEYWQSVKDWYIKKYGDDVNTATLAIAEEIGVSQRTRELIAGISQPYTEQTYDAIDPHQRIVKYADYRVTPNGITSLDERWQDLEKRYGQHFATDTLKYQLLTGPEIRKKMEADIFDHCSIKPSQITEASASDVIANLHDFAVS